MKLTIDRSKWLRGKPAVSCLLQTPSDGGKMCCLGFYALALGATESDIVRRRSPLTACDVSWPKWMLKSFGHTGREQTEMAYKLMWVNDNTWIPDAKREARLTKYFAKHGVEVTFIDGEGT